MKYSVLRTFVDAADGCRLYRAGGTYPQAGYEPGPERVRQLDGSEGRPALIAPAENEEAKKVPKGKAKKGA